MPTSRSSESSEDSEPNTTVISMSKRWTTLETIGRCMFLFSVAFFIIGVLITVFGFSNTGIDQRQQMPMKVLGPSCLAMTVVMWGVGCIFSRLWNLEWRRQQQALELRDRVQLHALAMDILNNPVISPSMLQDPRLRRQLLLKLRQQKTMDVISSAEENSRRSSKAVSVDSRRRQSSTVGTSMHSCDMDRRKSAKTDASIGDDKPQFELPGIQISRIETLDLGDAASILSGSARGSKRYIIIHSDVSSDLSRLSCPSDYSLAGSRSSKSRSSRASSGVSSRLWDFSPRESEWDADISLGSRESQINISRQDWAGGPSEYGRDEYTLSPTMPRKMSVVTFDVGDVGEPFRRHSSPAYTLRGRDVCTECICGRPEPNNAAQPPSAGVLKQHRDSSCSSILRYCDETRRPSAISTFRKKSEASIRSLRIEEDDGDDADETTPLTVPTEGAATGIKDEPKFPKSTSPNKQCLRGERPPLVRHNTEPLRMSEDEFAAVMSATCGRRESGTLRPPLKRNNTDDSEVERRVARLFKEIEFSVSDSVDESRINSQEYEGSVRRVEAETQTVSEDELTAALIASLKESTAEATNPQSNVQNINFPSKTGRNDSTGSYSDNLRESFESGDVNIDRPRKGSKGKEKKFKLSTISSALANLGKKVSLEKKSMKPKNIPKLLEGFSDDKDSPMETAMSVSKPSNKSGTSVKSTPPTYEDVVNKNL